MRTREREAFRDVGGHDLRPLRVPPTVSGN